MSAPLARLAIASQIKEGLSCLVFYEMLFRLGSKDSRKKECWAKIWFNKSSETLPYISIRTWRVLNRSATWRKNNIPPRYHPSDSCHSVFLPSDQAQGKSRNMRNSERVRIAYKTCTGLRIILFLNKKYGVFISEQRREISHEICSSEEK